MATMENVFETHETIRSIEKKLFDVELKPLLVADPMFKVEDWYGIFKSTGGTQLGIVGNRFLPTQPRAVFEAFCDAILKYGLNPSTLRYRVIKDGQIVRFSIRLSESISFINKFGQLDETFLTLNLEIGLNGKTKSRICISTLRKICLNGAVANFTEFEVSYKNVKGNQGKIVGMLDAVSKCVNQVKQLKQLYLRLNNIVINQEVIDLYLKRVHDIDMDKYDEYHPNKQANIDLINNSIKLELGRTGNTLFGLYNGSTHYANHVINTEDTDSVFTGVGSRLITKAEDTIFEMLAKPKDFSLQLAY